MRASFVLSEVLTGLRRNVTMTVAMILTTMVSLLLLGGGLLVVRMIDKTQAVYEDKLQVQVYLTDDISANDKGCADDPCKGLRSALENDPAVETVQYENRDQAYKRFKEIFASQPELVKLARPQALPASFNVKLVNPDRPQVIIQTFSGRVGVESVADQSEFLDRFFDALNGVRNLTFVVALIQAVAALLLISNTVQVSAFTRRTEVGIMRLVGATRWYTQLPFLLEAVVAGVIGAVLAIGLLVLAKLWFLDSLLAGPFAAGVIRPIEGIDILLISPWLLLTAIGISAVTGYVTLRLYVRQ
ncbi:permease-like cell division protein FtsX [Actinophytocola sp.]|jgi:cell division transport system permease protein|uniref:permease-like cell division protein FtsX n=1 Tax=Actinophytocola sp. TaxID=1872138 RepID=UPI002D4B74A1|nr:permease-like cell division protein FtsX [Actinophytocola sp.]HYQ64153.1 permease-like cell division protein FtsX [Actinophytocola sp.]